MIPLPECSVNDCDVEVGSRNDPLCKKHRARVRRHGDTNLTHRWDKRTKVCFLPFCDAPNFRKRLCENHYAKCYGESDSGRCVVDDCPNRETRPVHSGGLCNTHYWRVRQNRSLDVPLEYGVTPGGPCGVNKCHRDAENAGLCVTHYKRRRQGRADWDALFASPNTGNGHINRNGYRVISVNGRTKFEHTHKFEQILGRKLAKGEQIHHCNLIRDDNTTDGPPRLIDGKLRSGNLELWTGSHPSGARVPDRLLWMAQQLSMYGSDMTLSAHIARWILSRHGTDDEQKRYAGIESVEKHMGISD